MKCFLHIGTEKTATTTLQSFLHLNREELSRKGVGYTKGAGEINNFKLAVSAYDLDSRDDFTMSENISTNKALDDFQKDVISDLKKEIKKTSCQAIVFSSEHFQSRLTKISEIQRLKEILVDLGMEDIFIIVYLRNPSEIVNSRYSTAVKYGVKQNRTYQERDSYNSHICNHKKTLENFGSVFGKQSLIPRIFDADEFKNGSILEDFVSIIGIPWSEKYIVPDNKNESLSITGIEILRRLNRLTPRFIDEKENQLRGNIVYYFEKHFGNDKYIMSKELFEKYDDEFEDSNEWVRKNWFPERQFLFKKKKYPDETKVQIADEELERIAEMLADIWIDKSKRIVSLENNSGIRYITRRLTSLGKYFSS